MKDIFAFIKSKQFFLHLGISLLSLAIVLFVLLKFLSSYTHHREFVEVPDFSEKRVSELSSFVKDKGVNYVVIDSLYAPELSPGTVIKQDPAANSKVKHNRIIYLYVTNLVAPQIEMPKLTDRSERQAKLIITSYGLKEGSVTTKNADCNGCVIEQLYDGKPIEPGQLIKKGSKISIVVGVRDNYGYTPDSLAGQTLDKNTFNDGE